MLLLACLSKNTLQAVQDIPAIEDAAIERTEVNAVSKVTFSLLKSRHKMLNGRIATVSAKLRPEQYF